MFMCLFWFSEQTWISALHLFIKIQKFINNQQMHLIVYNAIIHNIVTNEFQPVFRPSSC
jgi:hypothetical protein